MISLFYKNFYNNYQDQNPQKNNDVVVKIIIVNKRTKVPITMQHLIF